MIFRSIFSLFLILPLSLNAGSLFEKIDSKIEVGLFIPTFNGTISNTKSSSDFQEDYGYSDAKASLFSLEINHSYDYIPNLYLSYFNMKDNRDTMLSESKEIADEDFNSSVSTTIDYTLLNVILFQDFKKRGQRVSFLNSSFYTGDIEFDIGINAKVIDWNYEIIDKTDLTRTPSWISANIIIPLPYIGVKYYLYDLITYANISALSFSTAKSTSYQYGFDYRIIDSLFLSAGYMYEKFKAVEDSDTINFTSEGYKFSFKYAF